MGYVPRPGTAPGELHKVIKNLKPGTKIAISDLSSVLQRQFKNGGSGPFRSDSTFRRNYKIELLKEGRGNENTHILYWGSQQDDGRRQAIAPWIRKALLTKDARCVICRSKKDLEVDHKDGRKDGTAMHMSKQRLGDFQILCQRCNQQKRQICIVCTKTNKRYDATQDGFRFSVTHGTLDYEESCEGCKYYDPPAFNGHCRLTVVQ